MNKQKIFLISVLAILVAGIFYFFYVPKPTCTMLRDPSGKPSEVCDLGGRQSPYQKMFLKMHRYFYPNDTCMISIETGDVDCEPSISLFSPICDQSATTTPCSVLEKMRLNPPEQPVATSTPVSEWETFENTKYGYEVRVPETAEIYAATYVPDIHTCPELSFSGERGYLNIEIKIIFPGMEIDIGKEMFEKQKKLLALDLKSYAEFVRKTQVDDKNPFVLNKKVGELKEVQLSNVKAYTFTLTGSFAVPFGGGYSLDSPHVYLITENLQGQKMIIHHTINETSEKMVQSIKFIK